MALETGDGRDPGGPDNGLLSLAWERAGGVTPGGGRDALAAPARARVRHLPRARRVRPRGGAAGRRRRAGRRRAIRCEPDELERLELPEPRRRTGRSWPTRCSATASATWPSTWTTSASRAAACAWAESVEVEVGDRRRLATYAHTFADVAAGRAAGLRGRLPHAGARGEPRRRGRDARGRARRRGAPAPGMIGAPRVHHRLVDSTNERAKALAAAGAPHGTLVTADEQTAGPRPPGPQLARRRRAPPCSCRWCCARRPRRCRWRPPWRWRRPCPPRPRSSGPTTCSWTAASSRASSWRGARRRAGPCSASG